MEFKFEFSFLDIVFILWEGFKDICGGIVLTVSCCTLFNINVTAGWPIWIMVVLASFIVNRTSSFLAQAIEDKEEDNNGN